MLPFLLDLTATEYHADLIGQDRPSLSSSVATTLVTESPLHAWLRHPKFGGVSRPPSEELDHGTLIHALVLKKGGERLAVLDVPDFRTAAAREARDAALAAGLVPVKRRDYVDAELVAADIRDELRAQGIDLDAGRREAVVVWEEDSPEGPVLCRGMLDFLDADGRIDRALILDLKTIRSAHPKQCARSVLDHGYDIQWAAYTSAVEKLRPDLAGRVDFVWAFAEELPAGAPKHAVVTLARPDGVMQEIGRSRWSRAVNLWAECLKTDTWPGYATGGVRLEPPAWAAKEELGDA